MFKDFDRIVADYKNQDIFISDQSLYYKKIEFIYNSNKLEGNLIDHRGTESVIRDRLCFTNVVRFKDILEVKGHAKALDNCLFMVKNKYPLTEKTIKAFNADLLYPLWSFEEFYASFKYHKQELGKYKVINNGIKYVLDGQQGNIEPLSNTETIEKNMEHVFTESKSIKHVIERSAHLAYQIFINQPFPDGNKRTARLVVVYLLLEAGLPLIVFKAETPNFNEGLLSSYKENSLAPLIHVIEAEVKQQLSEMIEMDKKLKINRTPPTLGIDNTLIF